MHQGIEEAQSGTTVQTVLAIYSLQFLLWKYLWLFWPATSLHGLEYFLCLIFIKIKEKKCVRIYIKTSHYTVSSICCILKGQLHLQILSLPFFMNEICTKSLENWTVKSKFNTWTLFWKTTVLHSREYLICVFGKTQMKSSGWNSDENIVMLE